MTADELTGHARTHIAALDDPACLLHARVTAPFLSMRRAALADGIDLVPQSSYRDFARQLAIWNTKWIGTKTLLDAAGAPLDAAALPPLERMHAILLWSALPGASRHHWGTDLDLVDRRATAADYTIKLTADEFAPGGPFARLGAWLEVHAPRFGFFRPYQGKRSGVQPEPWHFSFAPIAENARRALTPQILHAALDGAPLLGKELVLAHIEELHARYVASVDLP